jgi:hypothetical protein
MIVAGMAAPMAGPMGVPPVTERDFDEYHLYTLTRATTLLDRETKQVEFIRATGVPTKRIYVYDGIKIDANRSKDRQPDHRVPSRARGRRRKNHFLHGTLYLVGQSVLAFINAL